MAKILGIDLGTTNSAMAVVEAGKPKIIENKEGNRTTPSMVAVSKTNERLVGLLAKRQSITNPKNTIFSAKRLIGRTYTDEEIARDKKLLPYSIHESNNNGIDIAMGDKNYRPEEISAMVLQKLKHDAEEQIGEKITEAIITVPAYFDDAQRQATKHAGEIAGLDVKRIINEPTAAALAYGFEKKKDEQIVVYDFGGGTFDVSVLEVSNDTIEVKATGGDTHLGGDDFDQYIIHWLIAEFKKESGVDITNDHLALQRLKEAAEKAKHELSTTLETEINIPFITSGADGPQHLLIKMSRSKLESLVEPLIKKSIETTKQVVTDSKFSIKDIDEIILVGGQTRMPAIIKAVKDLFGKEPNKSINPDEVVALGAAIQGGILRGDVKDVLLLDVTPLSFGIETLGGVFTRLIEKNTTVPTSRSQVFSTAADNQTSVEVHVLQGEREFAKDNKTLGRFILDGIPPSPRGMPQVEVSFDIDANGILNVKAKDKTSGKEQSIRIEASSGLTSDEIERMKKDAEAHAEEDKKLKELIEERNTADTLIHSAEKAIAEAGDTIPSEIKTDIETRIEEVKKVKEQDDKTVIENAAKALSISMQKIGEHLAKQQTNTTSPNTETETKKAQNTDNVQDAEFTDVPPEDKKE